MGWTTVSLAKRFLEEGVCENIYSLLSCVGEKETLLREVDSVDLPGGRVNSFLGFLSPLERCPTVHPHADVSACFLKLPFVRVRLVLGRICCRDAYLKREIHIQTCARIFRRFRDVVFRQLVNQIYQIQTCARIVHDGVFRRSA